VVVGTLAVSSVGCGGGGDPSDGAPPVRLGAFDFAESEVLADVYALALEAAGLPVERLGSIGPREVVAPALERGLVDVVPEYLGTAAAYFGAVDDDVAALAAVLEPRGLVPLTPSPAEDSNVLVVIAARADERGWSDISDLRTEAPTLRLGGPVECPDRPLCLVGLRETYGLGFARFVPQRTLAVTAEALRRDEIDVGVMFSTAAELADDRFVVLEDDLGLQPDENVVPLVSREVLERWGDDLVAPLEAVSAALTTEAVREMNRQVDAGTSAAEAAAAWLRSAGVLDA
jgi:osmoprotectant transport system substrate-binding protein